MRYSYTMIVILFLFTHSMSAQAASAWEQTKASIENTNYNAYSPEGLWFFVGSNFGLVDINESNTVPDRDGHQINFKGLVSIYKPQSFLIYDLGLGFQSNKTSSDNDSNNTRSFFIDTSARYEFADQWSVGPVMNLLIGNKNTFTRKNKAFATFVGLTGHYEQPLNNQWILRLGARAMTDIDVSSRQVNKLLLDFQIGFPPTQSGTSNDTEEYAFEDSNFNDEQEYIAEVAPVINKPLVKIKIDDLNYRIGQVTPKFSDEYYLKRLATILTENQELFDKVTIKGHAADYPKTPKTKGVNKIISHSRSKDVLKRLATNGLPSSKIFSMAFSEYKPSTSARSTASADQRKVELEFSGVTDEDKLRELISNIK